MAAAQLKILHLEDSHDDAFLIAALLEDEFRDLVLQRADTQEGFVHGLGDPDLRIVLSDYSLPAYDGISALAEARHRRPELPFIFVSGAMGEDMAVECMKIGATDYVLKSNLKRLPAAIRRALSELDTRLTLTEAARVAGVVPWHWNDQDDTWIFGYLVQDILGYPPDLLKATPGFLKARVHPEDLARFTASFERARGRDRHQFDSRLAHADGRWLWTRWTLAWLGDRCRGVVQDITELHSTQEALIQSQRLEVLGMMIGGITHDFGNLISAMNGASELLALSPLDTGQRKYVDILLRSCARALEFKNELLRLARKEDAPARTSVHLNDLVLEATGMLRHAVLPPVEVRCVLDPAPPEVRGVPAQILQMVMNLGINARDAVGNRGTITVRTGRARLTEAEAAAQDRPGGLYAFVEVEDTGPGIPDSIRSRIFEVFFTTKPEGKGTGLGLAMVRAIVQEHDGLLQLESGPERGTRFRILLPVEGGV